MREMLWLVGLSVVWAEPFCYNGVPMPMIDDGSVVEVTFLSAPLLSVTYGPLPGELTGAYHNALLFSSEGKNWTLEFDAAAGMGNAVLPKLDVGSSLLWANDARFCLTEGILMGRDHWKKAFLPMTSITGKQFKQTFSTYIPEHNQSLQYQLWQVERPDRTVVVSDVTCGTGAYDLLRYMHDLFNCSYANSPLIGISHVIIVAGNISVVNLTDSAATAEAYGYYQHLAFTPGESTLQKMWHVYQAYEVQPKFVYSGGLYYRLSDLYWPYIRIDYTRTKLPGQ